MDFERASLLLNIIHMSVGVPEAAQLAKAAAIELAKLHLAEPVNSDQAEFDLSGKPVEDSK